MRKLLPEIVELLDSGQDFVLATIFSHAGSVPRTAGAKMLVTRDGRVSGTIGGGRLEAEVIKAAQTVLRTGKPLIHPFSLTGEDAAAMDMMCGGEGLVLLDFINATDRNIRPVFEEAVSILEKKEKGIFITELTVSPHLTVKRCLVRVDGTITGTFGGDPDTLKKICSLPPVKSMRTLAFDDRRYLVESISDRGTVYIFGAGHVSQKVAPLSVSVGFRTVVIDDRAEYANRVRFPDVEDIILIESFGRLPDLEIDEDSYVVIVTRGHLHDKKVLARALASKAGYIGMIGSVRKRDKIYEDLEQEGFGASDLAKVHCPIGTDIGAETPEELAVSIVGELIKARAEKAK